MARPTSGCASRSASCRIRREPTSNSTPLHGESGLSRPHFYKLFRTQTGLTPNLFLNTILMERALDRLVRSEAPVAEIGFNLGFSSQSGFTKFFSANVGMAPTDYRRAAHVI